MIANLITTVLLALGVATGNVSSNSYKGGNAFNHVERKPIQKQGQNYEIDIDETHFTLKQEYDDQDRIAKARKWYLGENAETPNYYNTYLNISNTIYEIRGRNGYSFLYSIFCITPMLNVTNAEVEMKESIVFYCPNTTNYDGDTIAIDTMTYETNSNLENYIDLTLNSSIRSTLEDLVFERNGIVKIGATTTNQVITANNLQSNMTQDSNTYTINEYQTKYIVMYLMFYNATHQNHLVQIYPSNFIFNGNGVIPIINYEVVDIPNLMFTILTLPFAWFSTAFNLTIFPNTPYAINFGNIVMTMIAALTLLYIIKKVLK